MCACLCVRLLALADGLIETLQSSLKILIQCLIVKAVQESRMHGETKICVGVVSDFLLFEL